MFLCSLLWVLCVVADPLWSCVMLLCGPLLSFVRPVWSFAVFSHTAFVEQWRPPLFFFSRELPENGMASLKQWSSSFQSHPLGMTYFPHNTSVGSRAPTLRSLRMSILLFYFALHVWILPSYCYYLHTLLSNGLLISRRTACRSLKYRILALDSFLFKFVHCRPKRRSWSKHSPVCATVALLVPRTETSAGQCSCALYVVFSKSITFVFHLLHEMASYNTLFKVELCILCSIEKKEFGQVPHYVTWR